MSNPRRTIIKVGGGPVLLLVGGLLSGCMRVHHLYLYPVCFYQSAPTIKSAETYYAPRLIGALHTAVKDPAKMRASLSPDGRWIVANVTKTQNAELGRVWPRIGCIGDAHNSDSTKAEIDCVLYQRSFVDGSNFFVFGNNKNPSLGVDIWNESPVPKSEVYCHEIDEKEPR